MAVKLDTSTGEILQKQIDRENNLKFKIAKILAVGIAVATVAWSGVSIYRDMRAIEAKDAETEALRASYEVLKQEAADWHAANDVKAGEDGVVVQQQPLYTARLAGAEAASLQNKLYSEGGLLSDDKTRMQELTGRSASLWYGERLDNKSVPLEWEFLTPHDAPHNEAEQASVYDVCWGCWYQGRNARYLIAVQFGKYDGAGGTDGKGGFTLGQVYLSDFAKKLDDTGAIEAGTQDGEGPVSQEDIDRLAEDMEEGTSGPGTGDNNGQDGTNPDAGGSDPAQSQPSETPAGNPEDTEPDRAGGGNADYN